MTKNFHRCMKCGYSLESTERRLCLPCFVADVKAKMSISTASGQAPRVRAAEKEAVVNGSQLPKSSETPKSKKAKKPKKPRNKNKSGSKVYPTSATLQCFQSESGKIGKKSKGVACILCGIRIPSGGLLAHKQKVHGEEIISSRGSTVGGSNLWVSVVQGGLPGLGKRR